MNVTFNPFVRAGLAVVLLIGSSVTLVAFDAPPENVRIANEAVPAMIESGALRVDKAACKAWIDPLVWMQFDAQNKEKAAGAIAVYCSAHDPVIEIYNAQSTRLLARWGWAKGLEVF